MSEYIRRLVSGNKARFKDATLNLELDLVYLTPRIIIMGYPADGIEAFYRNDRAHAKQFLEHRHGKKFWVFNFCPIRENSYDKAFFDGRVSRYPFPDHHAPPLAIMPLVAREIGEWLDGDPERVAVVHCKAGKGRSGTMACTYLLSVEEPPEPAKLALEPAKQEASEWAQGRAEDVMLSVEHFEDATIPPTPDPNAAASALATVNEEPQAQSQPNTLLDALHNVLELHTRQRMKPVAENEKQKQGVSIPSQRRWLHYWALLLAHAAPEHLWANANAQKPKVRLNKITVRMRDTSAVKIHFVRAVSMVLDRASKGKAGSAQAGGKLMWVSLARYDDAFVGLLERWERHTRDPSGQMGRLRKGAGALDGEELSQVFDDRGRWDKEKMVRSFARMGLVGDDAVTKTTTEDGKIWTYNLLPLTESGWVNIRNTLEETTEGPETEDLDADLPASEANSMHDVTQSLTGRGIVLDAGREVRVKIYMGQIFIGWAWFVPTFHMDQPPPSSAAPSSASTTGSISSASSPPPTKFTLERKQMDFPIGLGSALVDVDIEMEWVRPGENVQPPQRNASLEPEGVSLGMKIEAAATAGIGDAAEATEAARD
ncbi:Phosphatases II [Mycena kentingensis (nom. inval.)]|nr:Phosphatases II [Mycena kentingensis (nom. inval.)]